MGIDREGRPRVHELRARLQQRLARREQDVARAVADRDARGRHAVAVAELLAQQRVGWVGVAVERAQLPVDRLTHGEQRRVGRLVAGQAHERLLLGVAAGRGVDRDAPDALCELDRHANIVSCSSVTALRAGRKYRVPSVTALRAGRKYRVPSVTALRAGRKYRVPSVTALRAGRTTVPRAGRCAARGHLPGRRARARARHPRSSGSGP